MTPFVQALRRQGFDAIAPWYDSWSFGVPEIVNHLATRIAELEAQLPTKTPLHFVGHSMGGLIARALIARLRPAHLGRLVMLGSPNEGSELADFIHRFPGARFILGQAAPVLRTSRDQAVMQLFGKIDYPVGVIAGDRPLVRYFSDKILPLPHDGKVSVKSTHVSGEADHLVLPLSHMMLCYDSRAHQQTIFFLENGSFNRTND